MQCFEQHNVARHQSQVCRKANHFILTLLALLMLLAGSQKAQAVKIFAVRGSNVLISFDSATPQTIATSVAISGLQTGEELFGMDFRPSTSELYALGSFAYLYKINTTTGVATRIGNSPLSPNTGSSNYFGFDFDPVNDVIRLVDNSNRNFRLNPDTATITVDSNINPAGSLVGAAYTNSVAGATSTTLYAIDSNSGNLVKLNTPNNGTTTTVGSLGQSFLQTVGFDIDPRTNIPYVSLTVGGVTRLHTVNLATGISSVGAPIGTGADIIENLAVAPPGIIGFSSPTISIDENNVANITLNRINGSEGTVTVNVVVSGGSATANSDYLSALQTVSFASGETTKTLQFLPIYDFTDEGPEKVQLSLSTPTGGATINNGSCTVTINDVARNVSSATWFNSTAMVIPATGTSGTGNDGTSGPGHPASLYPSPIEVRGFLDLPVSKATVTLYGLSHTFPADLDIVLVAPDGRTTLLMSDCGYGNNNAVVNANLTFDDAATASLPAGTTPPITSGTYKPTDYVGPLTSAKDIFPTPVPVAPLGATLSNVTGAGPNGQWRLFIMDDFQDDIGSLMSGWSLTLETPPSTLAVSGPTAINENAGIANFVVTRSGNTRGIARLDYATNNGTAVARSDYSASNGTLLFADGMTTQTITVPILNDAFNEPSESFSLLLSNPRAEQNQAVLNGPSMIPLNIIDDDAIPALSINGVTIAEGNSGTTDATFTVALSAPSLGSVSVNYNAPAAGDDYQPASGTLVFAPGVTSQTFTVAVNGDVQIESDEAYPVQISVANGATLADDSGVLTIVNDDSTSTLPQITVANVSVNEGDSGTTNTTFNVSLSPAGVQPVTVNYTTADATALAGSDYATVSGTLTFAPGVTMLPVNVAVSGDTAVETNETFTLNLAGAVNAIVATASGTGTISNDDVIPAPQLLLYTPTSGLRNTFVTLVGLNLTGITSVKFNGVATTFVINSPTRITAKVPATATTGKITITTAGGTATSSGNYVVIPPPTLAGFTPASGSSGTTVTLIGTNFIGVRTIKFNNTIAQFTVVSPTRVTVKVPTLATTGRIMLTTLAGTVTSRTNFTVTPKIVTLSPASGAVGSSVIIDGLSFIGASSVKFNGKPAAFAVLSATRLRATVPATATTGKVTVTTPGGTASSAGNFTVTSAAPATPRAVASGLSSIAAQAATGVVTLQFSNVLDSDSPAVYNVSVNGEAVTVEGVSVRGALVSLALPEGALQTGNRVVVHWRGLSDNNGRILGGTAEVTVR